MTQLGATACGPPCSELREVVQPRVMEPSHTLAHTALHGPFLEQIGQLLVKTFRVDHRPVDPATGAWRSIAEGERSEAEHIGWDQRLLDALPTTGDGRGKGHSEAVRRLARRFDVDVDTIKLRLKVAKGEHPQPRADFRQSREKGLGHTEAARRRYG